MSDRKLAVLGMVAVLAAGWAVLQHRISQNVKPADFSSSPLIEGLQVDAIASITVMSEKGGSVTTLNRTPNGFVIANKGDYPADVSKINALVNNCLDIRTHEKITDNPDNHAELKVTDETARYRIAFLNDEGKEIVGLYVSESNEKGGAFVRLLSSNDVYSIENAPWIPAKPMDYVDAQLFQIPQEQMSSVAVRTPEDSYILNVTDDKSDIELKDMPAGKRFKGTDYKTVFGALRSLRCENVASAVNVSDGLEFDHSYTCKLSNKTVYKLVLASKGDKTYATISADYLDKSPVEKTVGEVESEEVLKAKEAKLLAIDVVKAFNQKHQGWVYQIPAYQAGNLTKPLSELLEDIPEPEAAPETAEPTAVQ